MARTEHIRRLLKVGSKALFRTRLRRLVASIALFACLAVPQLRAQIDTDNVLVMGRSAIAADDYVTAIHYFNQVIAAKPFLHRPYFYRAYAKFSLDDFSGADADCTLSINRNPYQVEVYMLRGICRIRLADYQGAASDYTQALRFAPDNEGALFNRALCQLELNRPQTAALDIDRLLLRHPRFLRAYNVKAQVLLQQGDTTAALHWIDRLLAADSNNSDGWAFKGRYALQKEHFAEADSCLTRAIALSPSDHELFLARALARHGENRFAAAIADYDRTIELVPQHFVAHYNRGLLLALVGENNKAIIDFSFVIDREPDNTLAVYNRALLRKQTGDFRGAIADLTTLIHQYPGFLYGYLLRAECYRSTGQTRRALNDETVVARANLDVTFGQRRRRAVKKVRRGSDHAFEQYEQLVADSTTTNGSSLIGRLLKHDLFGRIQDTPSEARPLPPFSLTLRRDVATRHARSTAFMAEVAQLQKRTSGVSVRLHSAAADGKNDEQEAVPAQTPIPHQSNPADSLLLAAVAATDAYDYATAQTLLQSLEKELGQDLAKASGQDLVKASGQDLAKASGQDLAKASGQDATSKSLQLLTLLEQSYVGYVQWHSTAAPSSSALSTSAPSAASRTKAPAASRTKAPAAKTDAEVTTLQRALAAAKQAVALAPENPYALFNLAALQAETGDARRAIEAYTHVLSIDANLAEAYFNRGLLHMAAGSKAEARSDLSRAGELGLYRAYSILKLIK